MVTTCPRCQTLTQLGTNCPTCKEKVEQPQIRPTEWKYLRRPERLTKERQLRQQSLEQ